MDRKEIRSNNIDRLRRDIDSLKKNKFLHKILVVLHEEFDGSILYNVRLVHDFRRHEIRLCGRDGHGKWFLVVAYSADMDSHVMAQRFALHCEEDDLFLGGLVGNK